MNNTGDKRHGSSAPGPWHQDEDVVNSPASRARMEMEESERTAMRRRHLQQPMKDKGAVAGHSRSKEQPQRLKGSGQ